MANERPFLDRVDDAILVQSSQLARLRNQPIRASIADFRQTSIENRELCEVTDDDGRTHRVDDYDIWALRVDRCDYMLADSDDVYLRRRVREALDHDR